MHPKRVVLARIGSVARCLHGCVHVQVGYTVIVLTSEQYRHLVAMLNESASNFELFMGTVSGDTSSIPDRSFPDQWEGPKA